ncbi:NAD(P)/FAD-dependent oxidoreductase [Nocardioides acrostichi]|uniref:FAD-dependent oxidoreductase n=1 Tax=Nocardioides acrostichi TaxID=2784339 RepID=A0A930Y696_9ACTN|nr:FAD-dependent oxidoreductase [Nocardioides acrostichi]MBF4160732.1 FAD-dependent oxidoreductase [Nocardioides acrostichi]
MAVIGAGAIGAAVSAEVSARGRSVLVLEQGAGWAAGCSWGNAGLICPSHAGPYATRADIGKAAGWLLSPTSPLGLAPRPELAPFMTRLLAHTRGSVADRVLRISRDMCAASLALHDAMVANGLATGLRHEGLLDTYETEAAFARARRAADAHRTSGLRPEILDAEAVRGVEPALSRSVVGGVLYPDEAHCDPLSFVTSVGAHAESLGARLLGSTRVLAVHRDRDGSVLQTTAGDVAARSVVLATGAWAPPLATSVTMPLISGKGYTVDLDAGDREMPARPFMLQESRVAVTPLGRRLRLAGTMEFTGVDPRLSMRRIEGIMRAASRNLPSWSDATVVSRWAGLRPCTPDGLPYLGWVDSRQRIAVAAGHAMLGLTLAPLAGVQIADLLEGKPVEFADPLSPHRFTRGRRRLAGAQR